MNQGLGIQSFHSNLELRSSFDFFKMFQLLATSSSDEQIRIIQRTHDKVQKKSDKKIVKKN